MHTALQRALAGALAYVVSYVLIGAMTVTRVASYLTPDPVPGVTVLEIYRSAGSPTWQAVGWFTLNAHGIPITVSVDGANAVSLANLVHRGPLWLGIVPGWFGLVPAVACALVGGAVARRRVAPVAWSVGTFMSGGYLAAVLLSTVVFSGAVGPVDASYTLADRYPTAKWLLPVVSAPLLFGSIGAFLGRSPLVDSLVAAATPD